MTSKTPISRKSEASTFSKRPFVRGVSLWEIPEIRKRPVLYFRFLFRKSDAKAISCKTRQTMRSRDDWIIKGYIVGIFQCSPRLWSDFHGIPRDIVKFSVYDRALRKITARFVAFIVSFYIRASREQRVSRTLLSGPPDLHHCVNSFVTERARARTHTHARQSARASPFADPSVQSGGFAREPSSPHRNRFAPDTDLAIEWRVSMRIPSSALSYSRSPRRRLVVAAPRRESAWITRSPSAPFDSSSRIALAGWHWNYENAPCACRETTMVFSSLEFLATVVETFVACNAKAIIGSGFAKRVATFRPRDPYRVDKTPAATEYLLLYGPWTPNG